MKKIFVPLAGLACMALLSCNDNGSNTTATPAPTTANANGPGQSGVQDSVSQKM